MDPAHSISTDRILWGWFDTPRSNKDKLTNGIVGKVENDCENKCVSSAHMNESESF